MATEILYEAIHKYIDPLFACCGIYIDPTTGILKQQQNGVEIKFVNNRYNGQPDVPQYIKPVVPLSDEHYIEIQNDPELDIYNPFVNRTHLFMILVKMREAMIPFCVSKEKLANCQSEDDYDEVLANYIQFYNSTENGQCVVGFANVEVPEETRDLYKFTSNDVMEATYGLAVIVAKDICGRIPKDLEDVPKAWHKAQIMCEKWNKARKNIKRDIKEEHLESFDINHMELSNNEVNNMWNPMALRIEEYVVTKHPGYTIKQLKPREEYAFSNNEVVTDEQNQYLTSLFNPASLTPVTVAPVVQTPAPVEEPVKETTLTFDSMNPVNEPTVTTEEVVQQPLQEEATKQMAASDYTFNKSSEQIPLFQFKANDMNTLGSEVKADIQPVHKGFHINKQALNNAGMGMNRNNMYPGIGMNPMIGGMNYGMGMGMNPMGGYGMPQRQNNNYDMSKLDLTGGDVVNPYRI